MEKNQIGRQMMEFNKMVFDNTFSHMATLQDQNKKIALNFLEKLSWFPEEGKKAFSQSLAAYNKQQEDFRAKAHDNYKKIAEYFIPAEKPGQ
jgi:predicted nucleotide-binding protein (sugar kinase/HSP70/actin superfamily)